MSTIVTRAGKGSPLTHAEVDANFTNLDTDKVEKTAAAITGGTINGTSIGATTPSTVNATTITGQTGVLNGTGQNLIRYSEDFSQVSVWNLGSVTVTTDTITAPNGTLTADTITANASGGGVNVQQNFTGVSGQTYTVSCWVRRKTGTGAIYLRAVENTNTTIAVTSDWQRFSATVTSTSTTIRVGVGLATSGDEVYVWGAQLEIASSVGAYVQTIASVVYGTPTLSFSGVSTIGLESNGALYLQPAGTGAIQAQATTSTTAGGNARGANAVDWQTIRSGATRVASGSSATVAGGNNNAATATSSLVAGGVGNVASGLQSAILGGTTNAASGISSSIVGGSTNTASGYYGFIGSGQSNSTTSNTAVTTQVATMNGTTAVTLSGSNASIKVGQYITGTTIPTNTYVAAISGTALTLSQAASGSGSATLSFFTPHGVVVGGGNNQATGSYSFIGGGGDAGTAANRNVASGDYSVVCGGRSGTASGTGSFVGGGGFFGIQNTYPNTASGTASAVVGGLRNVASAEGAFVGSGDNNIANANYSSIAGGNLGTARAIRGNAVFPACQYPMSTTLGVSQAALVVLARQTTDATPTALASDSSAAGTTNQVILPNNSAYFFRGEVVSGKTAAGDTKGWTIEGVIKRGANAASTALVGIPTVTSTYADLGAATWDIAVTADTTNGGIRVTFTGQAATTIRTVCSIRSTEMTF